jgi:predicted metal-dependent hydrolase
MKRKGRKMWESKREFKEAVYLSARELEVNIKQVSIRTMTSKWASCSTSGYFTFNAELLGLDRSLGEYVILHELLHYHIQNHGKLWKSLMTVHMPDHEKRANRLKKMIVF